MLFLFSFLLVMCFSDVPIPDKYHFQKKNKRAAIAIRDDVTSFQKFGSKLFTLPYLEKYYGKVYYYTQYHDDDKKSEFQESLKEAISKYEHVDIYLLSHTNYFYSWIEDMDLEHYNKIRMVYNTGCSGFEQKNYWANIGVASYVSHTGKASLSPIFYFYFLRRWLRGYSLEKAVQVSNSLTEETLKRFSLLFDENKNYKEETIAKIYGNKKLKIEN